MTGTFKTPLLLSVGIHAALVIGWPTTTTVVFDVERAPTSLEIRLVAPRATSVTPPTVSEPPVVVERPPDVAVVSPESQGALGEVLPAYLRNPAPRYPLLARQRREQGVVLLQVEVLPSGRCGRLTLSSSSGSALLDEAAVKTVRQWQFKPARRGGRSVAVEVEIPIRFQLVDPGDW